MPVGVQVKPNVKGTPVWAADFGGREHIALFPAKLDPALFTDQAGIAVVLTAGAAGNATTLAVQALSAGQSIYGPTGVAIPAGSVLNFGTNKFARLTADANVGDTTLAVAAIPTALVTGDTAVFSRFGTKFVPSGTPVSRTFAQRDANAPFHPAVSTDDEVYLLLFDIPDILNNADAELYRWGSSVFENYLPAYLTAVQPSLQNPLVAPTLGTATTGGTLVAGTYWVGYSYKDASGETIVSPATSIVVPGGTSTNTVTVTAPALPAGATGINVYFSPTSAITLAFNGTSATNTYTVTAPNAGGAVASPAVNTTVSALLAKLRTNYRMLKGTD